MNLAFDGLNSPLSFLLGFLLELFKLLLVLSLDFLLHLGKLDLVFVFSTSYFFLQDGAVILPFCKFELIQKGLAPDVFISFVLLIDFLQINLLRLLLLVGFSAQIIDSTFHFLDVFIEFFFVFLFEIEDFVSQDK